MSHEISGSEKMKDKCQTVASLTPEEIAQVAGGYGVSGYDFHWMIRGTPSVFRVNQPQLPGNVFTGGFRF